MAYNNYQKGSQNGSTEATEPKRVGSLWKQAETPDAPLSGYLDLGIDARLKVTIRKNLKKTSEKSPDYFMTVEVKKWVGAGAAQTTQNQEAKAAPPQDEVPF